MTSRLTIQPSAPESIFAIARLTVGEALRSRYMLFVIAFGLIAMIYMAQGQAAHEADRLRLLRGSIVQTIVLITMFSTLFLAAFALPADLESRRIYTIVSKPVSRSSVFLGRFVGFTALALVMAALLGVIGQVVLIAAIDFASPARDREGPGTDTGAPAVSRDLAPRYYPVALHTWGAVDGPTVGDYHLPTKALDGPHEAGLQALFADLQPGEVAGDAPRRLELRFILRLQQNRHIRDRETATIVMRSPGSEPGSGVREVVELRDQDAITLAVPVEAFGPFVDPATRTHLAASGIPERDGRVGTIVEVHLEESPFSVLIRPDSIALTGRPRPPLPSFAGVLLVEMVRLIFLLAIVLTASTALTPYTSILTGFFAVLLTNVTGTFRSQVDTYQTTLAFAQRLEYTDKGGLNPSLQVGLFLFGDPADPDSTWPWIIGAIEAVPDAYRYPVVADFVNGYTPAMSDCIGASWMFGTWALGIVVVGMVMFSMREIP